MRSFQFGKTLTGCIDIPSRLAHHLTRCLLSGMRMVNNAEDLRIHAVGPIAEGGSLPLAELARIAGGVQSSLDRLALTLQGRLLRPGRRNHEAVGAVQLAITALEGGSVTLRLAPTGQGLIDGDRVLDDALQTLGNGVRSITRNPGALPENFTAALVNGLRELASGIGPGKLTRIDLIRHGSVVFSIDDAFRAAVRDIYIDVDTKPATVVGRLHQSDFSPASLRCRIDTYAGGVLCDFDVELKDAVFDAMDCMVMASGTAQLQPDGTTIRTLRLRELTVLASATSRRLDELAREQGIGPIMSADDLVGEPIPDDEFDAFLEAIGRSPECDA